MYHKVSLQKILIYNIWKNIIHSMSYNQLIMRRVDCWCLCAACLQEHEEHWRYTQNPRSVFLQTVSFYLIYLLIIHLRIRGEFDCSSWAKCMKRACRIIGILYPAMGSSLHGTRQGREWAYISCNVAVFGNIFNQFVVAFIQYAFSVQHRAQMRMIRLFLHEYGIPVSSIVLLNSIITSQTLW